MSGLWKESARMKSDITNVLSEITDNLKRIEFLINPIEADYKIPFGFHTVGFTRVLLPEIYVSGVTVNGAMFRELYPFLKSLYTFLNLNHCAMHPAGEICKLINEQLTIAGMTDYQARPVDPTRLMYGQALLLRHWCKQEGTLEDVQGIQIVHRIPGTPDFPMVSTENQLLLDYVPFGVPCPELITGV